MQEIKCPNCGQVFQVDESGYAQIVQQIRDQEFEKELERRKSELGKEEEKNLKIFQMQHEQELKETVAKYKEEISRLSSQIDKSNMEKELAVTKAVQAKDKELSDANSEISKLRGEIELQEKENKLSEARVVEQYKGEIKLRDEEIERLKDFKARQSTKMVGESLEQHCNTQFNSIRMTAFPRAYFEKDNDARTGSKGDFIFRDFDESGLEFISIMFEMKNEMDTTATKHKNEDFFKELDKDRKEKSCEYAVLVSLLEADNELYNNGIVDVSYKYDKMYVIRPQFFIPLITLLRNAALNSLQYQRELAVVRSQQLDIRNFEENMNTFKEAFGRNYRIASEKFGKAIEEIDKSIDHLQKIKDALLSSENNLRLANNKAEDLSIKKLTKNAPTVRAMFEEIDES